MRLRTKLLLLMAVLLACFLIITLTGIQTINRVRMGSPLYTKVALLQEKLRTGIRLKADMYRLYTEELRLEEETEAERMRGRISAIDKLAADISSGFSSLESNLDTSKAGKDLAGIRKSWQELSSASLNEILPAVRRGDRSRVRELSSAVRSENYARIASSLDSLAETLRSDITVTETKAFDYARKTLLMGFLVAAGAFILILTTIWSVVHSAVSSVLKEASFARSVVEEGNLSARLPVESKDEIGELAGSLNGLVDLLQMMVSKVDTSSRELSRISGTLAEASKQVFRGAEQTNTRVSETSSAVMEINASTREVSHGIDSLSLSASENSSSVLEMAASVEEVAINVENLAQSVEDVSSSIIEMAAAIKHISDSVNGLIDSSTVTASSVIQMDSSIRQVEKNALDTAAISEEVRRDAESGKASVEATISGMQEIKRSSSITHEVIVTLSEKVNDIGAILSVINDVAEQTNLLALNAAIIAAQAGEQGKGFAVVADEIKELADRTSSSTREIEELIKGVQEETRRAVNAINLAEKSISDGEILSQKSGVALGKIVYGVEKATQQVGEIAGASAEQAKGSQMIREAMEQVTDMIMQIANATQQQSKGSELIMTAVERMKVLTSQVRSSTREQSKVGTLIATSTENITSMIGQIKRACDEQTRGSDQIVSAVEDIQKSTHEHLGAAGTMEKAVGGLSRQVDELKKEISGFTLTENR
ncbi:MAG: HAMP domain-containing methyl-accepting chemotaxis protein [Geobacteraceae bacterium]|nr:HAMP domain-containing methyl-accepting chemotaxis protein [Geobacteraceae bacterium]